MDKYTGNEIINIGSGIEVTIRDLAHHVQNAVGFEGKVEFDVTQPDGTPRKLLDCSKIHAMGWRHRIELDEGIKLAYEDFKRMLTDPECQKRM